MVIRVERTLPRFLEQTTPIEPPLEAQLSDQMTTARESYELDVGTLACLPPMLGAPRSVEELSPSQLSLDALDTTVSPVAFRSTVPETRAIMARRVDLKGAFDFRSIVHDADGSIVVGASAQAGTVHEGKRYIEFPNSTAMTTVDPSTGLLREFVLTREIEPYTNRVNAAKRSFNEPSGYRSDVSLHERIDGQLVFRKILLRSSPAHQFFFEDPRISVVDVPGLGRQYLLSGTDYSPHVPGATNPDVMNRFVVLGLDERGEPQPVPIDSVTRRPDFHDLSTPPRKLADGTYQLTDAKNGTIAINEDNEVVVRTRMRTGESYEGQVFRFASWGDFLAYDWNHAPADLAAGEHPADTASRIRPLGASVVETEDTYSEFYPKALVAKGSHHGFGPGTSPIRLERIGDELFVSDGKGAPNRSVGIIPKKLRKSYPVREGKPMYFTFDHELRKLADRRRREPVTKRVYTASFKLWESRLDKIALIYGDAIQPLLPHEIGGSGIIDLHHIYPMGRVILPHPQRPGEWMVRVYAGAADAHTESVDLDMVTLLGEMAEGSPQRKSAQVYPPPRAR